MLPNQCAEKATEEKPQMSGSNQAGTVAIQMEEEAKQSVLALCPTLLSAVC